MTVTAATLDLTTAYYIVDSADDMLTAEELALRPAAEALINKPAEVVAGPMSMSEAWDLYYRGRNGNIADDELDRYVEAVEKIESIEREKAEKEAAAKAEAEAAMAEYEAEERAELEEAYGVDTVKAIEAWYEKYNKFGLADGWVDCMLDSGVMEDGIDEGELDAFKAFLAEGELADDVDDHCFHELVMERVADYPERFPVTNGMTDEIYALTAHIDDDAAEVAYNVINGYIR